MPRAVILRIKATTAEPHHRAQEYNMTSNYSAAVVGLGSMGLGMANSLHRADIRTYGCDVNPDQTAKFTGNGGLSGELPSIAKELDCLVLVVVNAAQTKTVIEATVSMMTEGSVIISCATVSPDFAREMQAYCQQHKVHYLDAPISGGSVKAADGRITVLASGTDAAFNKARPALDAMAEKVFELGDSAGPGSALKVVNQLLAGVHIAAAAEAITFGISQGIDAQTTVDVISQCAGSSWMFENRGPHIANGDYTPHSAVDIFVKDLGIVCDIAHDAKFPAPLSSTALAQFAAAAQAGLGREDDAAVAKVYAKNANLTLP